MALEHVDEQLPLRGLSDFAHTLARRFEVSEVLYRLTENVMSILKVAGAGVSLVDDQGRLRPVTAAIGAMNIYSTEPRRWRETDVQVAQVLGGMAAGYVANASDLEQSRRTTEQLREALESRIIIEQAKGMLASEYRISVDQAFAVLR